MLENAFIIYKANRYDLKDKMFLKTLKNIVYLELIRRGYDVAIGKIGSLEVDFVATKVNEKIYYQVSATVIDQQVRERDLRSLQAINDNYPKFILTMDQPVFNDYSGTRIQNILDFLLE